MSPKATPVTRVSTTSQKVRPASRPSTSSASIACSVRKSAVVSTASTPEPWNSSASTYAANGTSSVSPIWSVGSSSRPMSRAVAQPRPRPTATATTADSASVPSAAGSEKPPLTAAARATW